MINNIPTGIFVAYRAHLTNSPGGVQACTQEYLTIIRAAGIKVEICSLENDHGLLTRLMRHLVPSAYFQPVALSSIGALNRIAMETKPDFIFLNQVSLATLAQPLKEKISPKSKIVLLSHGLESTDLLHIIRLNRWLPLNARLRPTAASALGAAILKENALRKQIDIVCTLSEFDVTLEHWIGATSVEWLPRTIQPDPLLWAPQGDRLGFVGTLGSRLN